MSTKQLIVYAKPSVIEVVQKHYDCASAKGMPLEDFGGDGTAGSHWDMRHAWGDITN